VNKAAIDNISPGLATTVLVGDKNKIINQLEEHHLGEIVVVEKI
jgi:hypothetical protein